MFPERGNTDSALDNFISGVFWSEPLAFFLPEEYYGMFEINGPLSGFTRFYGAGITLQLGIGYERLISDEHIIVAAWFPDGVGIQGWVRQNVVYGFYLLWGTRWVELEHQYLPFGHAFIEGVQARPEMVLKKAQTEHKVLAPEVTITIREFD